MTVAGVLTVNGLEAVMSLDGALNRYSSADCLEHVLGLMPVPGDVVVLANLRVHHVAGMAELVEARGALLLFLPPYSPILYPSNGSGASPKLSCARPQPASGRRWKKP